MGNFPGSQVKPLETRTPCLSSEPCDNLGASCVSSTCRNAAPRGSRTSGLCHWTMIWQRVNASFVCLNFWQHLCQNSSPTQPSCKHTHVENALDGSERSHGEGFNESSRCADEVQLVFAPLPTLLSHLLRL